MHLPPSPPLPSGIPPSTPSSLPPSTAGVGAAAASTGAFTSPALLPPSPSLSGRAVAYRAVPGGKLGESMKKAIELFQGVFPSAAQAKMAGTSFVFEVDLTGKEEFEDEELASLIKGIKDNLSNFPDETAYIVIKNLKQEKIKGIQNAFGKENLKAEKLGKEDPTVKEIEGYTRFDIQLDLATTVLSVSPTAQALTPPMMSAPLPSVVPTTTRRPPPPPSTPLSSVPLPSSSQPPPIDLLAAYEEAKRLAKAAMDEHDRESTADKQRENGGDVRYWVNLLSKAESAKRAIENAIKLSTPQDRSYWEDNERKAQAVIENWKQHIAEASKPAVTSAPPPPSVFVTGQPPTTSSGAPASAPLTPSSQPPPAPTMTYEEAQRQAQAAMDEYNKEERATGKVEARYWADLLVKAESAQRAIENAKRLSPPERVAYWQNLEEVALRLIETARVRIAVASTPTATSTPPPPSVSVTGQPPTTSSGAPASAPLTPSPPSSATRTDYEEAQRQALKAMKEYGEENTPDKQREKGDARFLADLLGKAELAKGAITNAKQLAPPERKPYWEEQETITEGIIQTLRQRIAEASKPAVTSAPLPPSVSVTEQPSAPSSGVASVPLPPSFQSSPSALTMTYAEAQQRANEAIDEYNKEKSPEKQREKGDARYWAELVVKAGLAKSAIENAKQLAPTDSDRSKWTKRETWIKGVLAEMSQTTSPSRVAPMSEEEQQAAYRELEQQILSYNQMKGSAKEEYEDYVQLLTLAQDVRASIAIVKERIPAEQRERLDRQERAIEVEIARLLDLIKELRPPI